MTATSSSSSSSDGGGKKDAATAANSPTTKASVSFASTVVIPDRNSAAAATSSDSSTSPFLDALSHHRVKATVIDLDHYRIHGGMAVETDYIVHVQAIPKNSSNSAAMEEEPEFDSFLLSKTFSAFRTMAQQLKKAADAWTLQQLSSSAVGGAAAGSNQNADAAKDAKYCELVSRLVESQRTQYMGKVNYRYVKVLAKNRTTLINNVLQATCLNYYPSTNQEQHRNRRMDHHQLLITQVASIIETFFLTDHCCSDEPVAAVVAAAAAAAAAATTSGAATTSSSSANTSSHHHLLGTAMGKIVTTVEDGVAAAAQKTKELTRGGTSSSSGNSDGGGAGGHHHHNRTGSNPLGWLPFMDNNKDKKETGGAASTATAAASRADDGSSMGTPGGGTRTPRGGQRRASLVVPLTRKDRRSETLRAHDEKELSTIQDSARLLLDDDSISFFNKTTNANKQQQQLVPSYARPQPVVQSSSSTKIGKFMDTNPIVFLCICAAAIALLQRASQSKVIIDADMALLVIFASYCLGLHTPRPMVDGYDKAPSPNSMLLIKSGGSGNTTMVEDRSGRRLLARSMKAQRRNSTSANTSVVPGGHPNSSTGATAALGALASAHHDGNDHDNDDDDDMDDPSTSGASTMGEIMGSPMSMFPVGAKIGSVTNCWGYSDHEDFQVRGATYLHDKQKVSSDEYLFPVRGVDLFLTDTCPENVGANAGIFGGHMRSLPTLLINFRLPWGVLIFYFEIPTKFVPYLQMCYEPDDETLTPEKKAQLMQELQTMTPGERCTARFLMKDQSHKNQTFKIIPYVVNGPWVVRQVVGGKPALIGNKLPISWVYQSAEKNNTTTGGEQKACYLEADLDIAASSAARSILSVARTYCQVLTLDLGFVVQGNTEDELPEQMLVGCRLHGIDPLTSPSFPMSTHNDNPLYDVVGVGSSGSDDENSRTN